MVDIKSWVDLYKQAVVKEFGARVLFVGLQGSYGRQEAGETSDLDPVLILDKVDMADLIAYKQIIENLPYTKLICGFVSGKAELASWAKADLFQFYFDTVPLQGRLEDIISIPTVNEAKAAVLTGACNIYHGCSHNFLHTEQAEILQGLYKGAFFILQAKIYCETGQYPHNKNEMKDKLHGGDKAVFEGILNVSKISQDNFESCTKILLCWAKDVITQYKEN